MKTPKFDTSTNLPTSLTQNFDRHTTIVVPPAHDLTLTNLNSIVPYLSGASNVDLGFFLPLNMTYLYPTHILLSPLNMCTLCPQDIQLECLIPLLLG